MKTLQVVSFVAALILAVGAGGAAADSSHKPGTMEHMHRLKDGKKGEMMDCHQGMANQANLKEQAAAMEDSRGKEQVPANAAAVEELAARHQAMHQSMACMESCGGKWMGSLPSEREGDPLGAALRAHVLHYY